jgi:hypothetical protein
MLLFIALGQWLVGVPSLQTAEFSGNVLIAIAMRYGLIGHPNCTNESDRPGDLPDLAMVVTYAEPWGCNVLELAPRLELGTPACRWLPSPVIRTGADRAWP